VKTRTPPPNLRQQVVLAARQANVPLDEWDRAQVLGRIAGLIAAHPKVRGMLAFKGGAIMHLVDRLQGSPRSARSGRLRAGLRVRLGEPRPCGHVPSVVMPQAGRLA
jgi:hypothetical protein